MRAALLIFVVNLLALTVALKNDKRIPLQVEYLKKHREAIQISKHDEDISPNVTSLASIQWNGRHQCAGSIISQRIILTAASCVGKVPPKNLTVRVGSFSVDAVGTKYEVIAVQAHEKYFSNFSQAAHDLALIKVLHPIQFNSNVRPINLASEKYFVRPGTNASLIVWSWMSKLGDANLHIINCTRNTLVGQICTSLLNYPTQDKECRVDAAAGGPLVANGIQIGIAPWNTGCKWPEYGGTYTDVSHYRRWIMEKIIELDRIETDLEKIRSHPWLASIQVNHTHKCSGSIISNRIVLTAASCVDKRPISNLTIRVGSASVNSGGSVHNVTVVRIHESYKLNKSDSIIDIAMLKVSPSIQFNSTVDSIKLSRGDYYVFPGTNASLAGWGQTNNLRETKLRTGNCPQLDGYICAGLLNYINLDKDCRLDSGGPLVANGFQIGVVPGNTGCNWTNYKGVYPKIYLHHNWIEKNMMDLNIRDNVGEISEIQDHPWLASVQWNHNHYCTGSIISKKMVLTTARFIAEQLNHLTVRVGSSRYDEGGSEHRVTIVISYDTYNSKDSSSQSNLHLLMVLPNFKFNNNLRPIPLARKGDIVVPGTRASVAGWETTIHLRSAQLKIVNCHESDGLICASQLDKEVCQGGHGAPLVVDGKQVGVMRLGSECTRPGSPGVFIKISDYRDWIDKMSSTVDTL